MTSTLKIYTSLLLSLLLASTAASAQKGSRYVADTSFTIASTMAKEVKRRPYITLGMPDSTIAVAKKYGIAYKTTGHGRTLLLDLYGAATGAQRATIVMVHGGGWSSGSRLMNESMAMVLAQRGYTVASIEYRLSPEARFPAAIEDVKSAVIFLKEHARQYGIDTAKIALVGFSAGGQLAALAGATNGTAKFTVGRKAGASANVAAVVDVDGLLDFTVSEKALIDTAATYKSDLLWLGGTYRQQMERWIEASPITWVNRCTAPILFINSSNPRFHCGRDAMIDKMRHFGVRSAVHTFDDTPHTFWFFNPWFTPTCQLIDTFLRETM